jgi:putative restriction endonuclease
MPERPANDGMDWTRDQLVIAFELYCRTPFQKTKASNPEVKRTALLLGRTPASVARKLGNFGAFDPQLREKGITGLTHSSRLDKVVWDEFHHDWNALVEEASRLRGSLGEPTIEEEPITFPVGPSERLRVSRERIHQAFFRQTVVSSYECRCCITGINVQECLVAGHIVPWATNERLRADPTNGLCLSATFDRLFDSGLMTITIELTVLLSARILTASDTAVQSEFARYQGKPIMRPRRFCPSTEHLAWHRSNVFRN